MINDITDIRKIALKEGEMLAVRLPAGDLSTARYMERASQLEQILQTYFLSNRIVIYSDELEFTAISQEIKND
jgi:hypothetical protein